MSPSSEQPQDTASGATDSVGAAPSPESGVAAAVVSTARVVRPEELLEGLLAPVIESMGYELVHIEFSGSGKHRRLQVFLDGLAEGGFSLNDCAKMAPIVSSTLDAAEVDPEPAVAAVARVLKAPYVLEVSSPGIDRPLAKLSHFRRHIGGLAKVTTFSPLDAGSKQKNFNGRIEDVQSAPHAPEDDRAGAVTLVDPDGGAHQVIDLEQIRKAHLVYEG